MKAKKTWIVVADGAKTRVFLNDGPGRGVNELESRAREIELKESRDINADRPGRTFDSGGQGRHAMEPPTDAKRYEKERFARDVVKMLNKARTAHEFDRLILIAPPSTLGDLRSALPKELAAMLHGELPKDLTRADARELEGHLGDMLAV